VPRTGRVVSTSSHSRFRDAPLCADLRERKVAGSTQLHLAWRDLRMTLFR
jgi:hypothetical protein